MTRRREIEITKGPLADKILNFALPLALTGILQQLFNAADIAVVGRFTGEMGKACMAAVGANAPVIGLLINLFVGVGLGANVVISTSIGQKREDLVSKAVLSSLLFALCSGLETTVFAEVFADSILRLQKVNDEVISLATIYLRIYLIGMPVILLYNFEAAIFRGLGDTRTPLITLMLSGVINVILNLIFVAVFRLTVEGVALATVISNAISAGILLFLLIRTDSPIKLKIRRENLDSGVLKRMLAIGVPAGLQGAVFAFANIIIQSAINSLGTVVMAASSAAYNIESFAYYVFNSFSQACTTFVGQNYGAGKPDRCRKSFRLCLIEGYICFGIIVFIILFFGRDIIRLFNKDAEVIDIAYLRLQYIFFAYCFSTLYEMLAGYMRGFGISLLPAILTMTGIVGSRLSWIWIVFPKYNSFDCIMLIYPISLCLAAVLNLGAVLAVKPGRKLLKES